VEGWRDAPQWPGYDKGPRFRLYVVLLIRGGDRTDQRGEQSLQAVAPVGNDRSTNRGSRAACIGLAKEPSGTIKSLGRDVCTSWSKTLCTIWPKTVCTSRSKTLCTSRPFEIEPIYSCSQWVHLL